MNTASTVEEHPHIPEKTAIVELRKISIEGSTLAVLGVGIALFTIAFAAFTHLSGRIDGLGGRMDSLDAKIDRVASDLRADMRDVNGKIDKLTELIINQNRGN